MRTRRRKIWEKRISFILIIMIIIIVLLQGLPKKITLTDLEDNTDYYASSQDTRKIISLVYDDSASMSDQGNVNWAYANYAFQIFIGLLNPKDSLYITYMSKPKMTTQLVEPMSDRQSAVLTARSHYRNSNTPITAVNSAYNKLNSFEKTTEPVEYWLVIITDGYLQSAATGAVLSTEYINQTIKDYSNMTLDNGEPLHVVYMAIGDEVAIIDENDEDNKAILKYAKDSEEIITRMSEIAMEIGDWSQEVKGITAKFIDKNRAEVTISNGPLEKIAALIQGTHLRIIDVKKEEEITNNNYQEISQDLQVQYPEYPGCTTDEKLIGSVQFVTGTNGFLDVGKYIITFDGEIAEEYKKDATVDLFFDSALETRLYIYNDEDNRFLRAGEVLSDQVLYTFSTEAYVSETEIKYTDYMLEKVGNKGAADYKLEANVPNLRNYSETNKLDSSQYTLSEYVGVESIIDYMNIEDELKVNVPLKHAPIYATKIAGTRGSILRTDLVNRSLSMKLKIYHDDMVYTRKEIQNMRLKVECSEKYVDVYTHVDTDGTITITPYFGNISPVYKIFLGWLQSWVIEPGANQIVLSFYDEAKKEAFVCREAFTIEKESLSVNVWNHIKPFLALLLLWGYTYKPRFKKGMQIHAIALEKDNAAYKGGKEKWVELKNIGIKKFLPYFRDVIETEEAKILADAEKDSNVTIKAQEGWNIKSIILREDTISRSLDVVIHEDSERLIDVNTDEISTDENMGFIMINEENKEYSLFIIRFTQSNKQATR